MDDRVQEQRRRVLRGVLSHVESTLCVDQNRLFVTGYSNGAVMASVLACVDAAQVAAIAPVSGIANPANCKPSRPVSVVAFHGTSDPLIPYTGGLGAEAYKLPLPAGTKGNLSQLLGNNVPQSTKGPSIPTSTAAWATRDGCASSSTTRVVANNVALISYTCPTVQRSRCTASGEGDIPGRAARWKASQHPRRDDDGHFGRQDHLEFLSVAPAPGLNLRSGRSGLV